MLETHKDKALLALKKTRGQLDRVEKMMKENSYCPEIMRQTLAGIGYLKSLNNEVLKSHMKTCGLKNLTSTSQKDKDHFVDELIKNLGLNK